MTAEVIDKTALPAGRFPIQCP